MVNARLFLSAFLILALGGYIQMALAFAGDDYLYKSDTGQTFEIYQDIVDTGELAFNRDSLLSTSIMTTAVPAYIVRTFHLDHPVKVFKYYCATLVSLLPVVVFFIIKKYAGYGESVAGAIFITAQFYFIQANSLARINISLLFFALGILVLVSNHSRAKLCLLPIVGGLIVISHYGTAFIVTGLVLVAYIIGLIRDRQAWSTTCLFVWLMFMVIAIGSFYSQFELGPLFYGKNFILRLVGGATTSIDATVAWVIGEWFFNIGQYAKIWPAMLFSWLVFWLCILSWILGLYFMRKAPNDVMVNLALPSVVMIMASLAIPHIGMYYGFIRVYYTAMIVLSLFFVKGAVGVSTRMGWPGWVLPGVLSISHHFVLIMS